MTTLLRLGQRLPAVVTAGAASACTLARWQWAAQLMQATRRQPHLMLTLQLRLQRLLAQATLQRPRATRG
jgi:hypothetical protein